MADITAIILTKNEEKNLPDCLKSIKGFCSRAVVVDCGSTDRTVEIAKEMGADVYFHEFEYYARQFNWGIDNCDITTEWTMRLDADERVTPDVVRECEALIAENMVNGITMEATYFFMGRAIDHGISKKRKLMIFRTGIGRIEDRRRDAHTVISEGESAMIKARFLHHDFKDLTSYINRYNWYATREMLDYVEYISEYIRSHYMEKISVEEFARACPKVSKTHIENRRAAGAFGALPDTSQITLF